MRLLDLTPSLNANLDWIRSRNNNWLNSKIENMTLKFKPWENCLIKNFDTNNSNRKKAIESMLLRYLSNLQTCLTTGLPLSLAEWLLYKTFDADQLDAFGESSLKTLKFLIRQIVLFSLGKPGRSKKSKEEQELADLDLVEGADDTVDEEDEEEEDDGDDADEESIDEVISTNQIDWSSCVNLQLPQATELLSRIKKKVNQHFGSTKNSIPDDIQAILLAVDGIFAGCTTLKTFKQKVAPEYCSFLFEELQTGETGWKSKITANEVTLLQRVCFETGVLTGNRTRQLTFICPHIESKHTALSTSILAVFLVMFIKKFEKNADAVATIKSSLTIAGIPESEQKSLGIWKKCGSKLNFAIATWTKLPRCVWAVMFPGIQVHITKMNSSHDKINNSFLHFASTDGYRLNSLCVNENKLTACKLKSAAVDNHGATVIGFKDGSAGKIHLTSGTGKLSLLDPKILGDKIPNLLGQNQTGKILSKDKSSINVQSGIRAFGLKKVYI
jgi:hypothetical protein